MKQGFILIELLAVILILGIIALIAIPTVNKILNEAREGAFRTSSDNIMKSMEQACQTSLIRGYNPVLSYIFTVGKSSSKLDVKGTMPDDGYVFLDNECSVTDYFLRDKNYTYSNGEDIRQDYMLKAPTEENTSILKTLYPSYYDNIVTVNFINNITVPEGMLYANFVLNKVIMNNSDYTSVNKIITNIESKTSESIGTISITGVDNISKVDTTTANSKYWNII